MEVIINRKGRSTAHVSYVWSTKKCKTKYD